MKKQITVMACVLVTLLCVCSVLPAMAYVLPGPHLLELMTKKIGAKRSFTVSQHLTIFHDEATGGRADFQEELQYLAPNNFRSEIISENTHRIYIESGDRAIELLNGSVVEDSEGSWFYDYKDILLIRDRELLQSHLEKMGMDFSGSRVARFDGRICFVIGDGYSFNGGPELWIDKESFRPVRFVVSKGDSVSGRPSMEIRFYNWQAVGKKIWYPMIIEFYLGEESVRLIEVDKVDMKAGVEKKRFSIDLLENLYRNSGTITEVVLTEDLEPPVDESGNKLE